MGEQSEPTVTCSPLYNKPRKGWQQRRGGVPLWAGPAVGEKTETCFHFCVVSVDDKALRVSAIHRDGLLTEEFEVGYVPQLGSRNADRS